VHRKKVVQLFETIIVLIIGDSATLPIAHALRQALYITLTCGQRPDKVRAQLFCRHGALEIMRITIYHNPRCSKSRKTLEIIQDSGIKPRIVEYLVDAPDAATTRRLAKMLGLPVAGLLRRGEAQFKDASDLPDLDDDAALATWLALNPKVLERPIVVDEDSATAVIGRPPENVLELLGT